VHRATGGLPLAADALGAWSVVWTVAA
jgi:hypothetical protein